MLVKIFSTATLIVLAWLSLQMLQAKQSNDVARENLQLSLDAAQENLQLTLADLRTEISGVSTQNETLGSDLISRMDRISDEQVKLKEPANRVDPDLLEAKNRTIARMQEAAELQNAYATVLKANLAANEKQGTQAAKLLTSTKKTIWKTSDKWTKNKGELRELMAPIDSLAGKWNRGDYSANTKSIQKTLVKVLEAQSLP